MVAFSGPRGLVWIFVGLWTAGAACGPLPGASATEGATEGTTSGSTSGTTSASTIDAITTALPTTAVDPTFSPECEKDNDCNWACAYCDQGVCRESPGCCDYAHLGDGVPQWRCSPPPEEWDCFYLDEDCLDDQICVNNHCVTPTKIPMCERQTLVLSTIPLADTPVAALLVDVDGDGDLDLVATEPASSTVEIAHGDGAGGLTGGSTHATGLLGEEHQLLAGTDLDLDGDLDLVVLRAAPVGELSLLLGQDGAFLPPTLLPMGERPSQLFAGRFDADAVPDILVIDGLAGHTFTLRAGDGMGGLGPEMVSGGQSGDYFPGAAFDLDGDGTLSIAVPIDDEPVVQLFNLGPDGFEPGPAFPGPGRARYNAALVGPVFADTPNVLATRSVSSIGTIAAWDATNPNYPWPLVEVGMPFGVRGVALADVDGDGRSDLLTIPSEGSSEVQVVFSGPAGPECWQGYPLAHPTTAALVVAGDLDGDGKADIIAGDPDGPSASLLRAGP